MPGVHRPLRRTLSAVRRYHVTTFGCQMNAHDSERIRGLLEEFKPGEAADQAEADVLVFNTRTIREKPDQRLAAYLGDAKTAQPRRGDRRRRLLRGGAARPDLRALPFIDVAFGLGTIHHLKEWLAGGLGVPRVGVRHRGRAPSSPRFLATQRERRFQAWVQISMGCNSVCSYCIVPAVRGREVSRRPG